MYLSIILALIITIIFYCVLQKREFIILDGNSFDNFLKKKNKNDSKCYEYRTENISCNH
jgi:hypothetical protein